MENWAERPKTALVVLLGKASTDRTIPEEGQRLRPLHPCANPACSALVRGSSRCPTHTITREQRNPKDPAQAKFYGSTQWKAIRAGVRRNQPICGMCHRKPTTTAHHKDNNWRNNLPENHQGVCDPCHRTHSGSEHYRKRTHT